MTTDPIVIVGMSRTPMGAFQGDFAAIQAPELGAVAIKGAIDEAKINPKNIEEIFMGCVLTAGIGQAPARQASIGAGIPFSTSCTTVNKMCGSGMQAIILAYNNLMASASSIIIAGGMESMTNAPYILPKMRSGARIGHTEVRDHMFYDGLEDAYEQGKLMGVFAEKTAEKYSFSREAQDEFSIISLSRANNAINQGHFKREISSVTMKNRKSSTVIDTDEQPGKVKLEKIPTLRPAFAKKGTVTAANSSSISDGASAVVMMRASEAEKRSLKPIAKIVGHSLYSHEPNWFTTAPVGAIKKLYKKINWSDKDVDLYEINEAFAVVTMAAMADLDISHNKVNVHGGACALGHPIGSSGSRIIITLIAALETYGKKRGIASLCIGGGEATAIAIELI
ncbi:acetyl-CoA C-acyltransferase [Alphaproteobacteria bacterium]|nr:acetyl-CoA C-acyltransferase [Alphaproteobacteria bacterium]